MAAETIQKIPRGYIAIDIERTGRTLADITFAFGLAHAPRDAKNITELKKMHVCLNLKKPSDMSWQEFWIVKGFEQRCWNEFWSKPDITPILDFLQNPIEVILVDTLEEFARMINDILHEAEECYERSMPVIDCPLFDPVHVGEILTKYGYMPIQYTRSNRYRSSWEIDSFIAGIGCFYPEDWEPRRNLEEKKMKRFLLAEKNHNHHPENDAESILLTALAAVSYAKYLKEKRDLKKKEKDNDSPKRQRSE